MRHCKRCGAPTHDEKGKRTHRLQPFKSPVPLPRLCPLVPTSYGTYCRPELLAGLEARHAERTAA